MDWNTNNYIFVNLVAMDNKCTYIRQKGMLIYYMIRYFCVRSVYSLKRPQFIQNYFLIDVETDESNVFCTTNSDVFSTLLCVNTFIH